MKHRVIIKWAIFLVGFIIAAVNYVNAGVFELIIKSDGYQQLAGIGVMPVTSNAGTIEDGILALGFMLIYSALGGIISVMSAQIYLYICEVIGIKPNLYKFLMGESEDEQTNNKKSKDKKAN